MKTLSFLSSISRKGLLLVVSAMLALSSAFSFSVRVAHADDVSPQSFDNYSLANSFKKVKKSLATQQSNLATANTIVSLIQDLMAAADIHGIDTSAISTAVTSYQAQLVSANAFNQTAAGIVTTHDGFDNNGNVTDPVAAAQTINSAKQALQSAHAILVPATTNLYGAVSTWEGANPILKSYDSLHQVLTNQNSWLIEQQSDLDKSATVVMDMTNLINAAHANKIGKGGLPDGLTAFQKQLTGAQTSHTTAANLLTTHSGFDGDGNVLDVNTAQATVLAIAQPLGDARAHLLGGAGNLLHYVNDWQAARNIPSTSPVYPIYRQTLNDITDFRTLVRAEHGEHAILILTRLSKLHSSLLKEL